MIRVRSGRVLLWLVLATLAAGCSKQEAPMPGGSGDYKQTALAFTKALASRDYRAAYDLTHSQYRRGTSLDEMRAAFEAMVPLDWKLGEVEVGETMEAWPGKEPSDVGWAYVSIGGDIYSEAVVVVIAREGGDLRVRTVEFGRP